MRFVSRAELGEFFKGKSVAIVGSGPSCLENAPRFVDSHDIACRVNNFKTGPAQGFRTDVFYSFFGGSILKTRAELEAGGVKLCMCKCPDSKFIESEWHRKNNKMLGTDFSYIYKARRNWWFTDTFIPSRDEFMESFELLGKHIPSTGFSALWTIASLKPKSIYLTGMDFFSSRIHNVNEPWRPGNPDDPIGHAPERERAWLAANLDGITLDPKLTEIMGR